MIAVTGEFGALHGFSSYTWTAGTTSADGTVYGDFLGALKRR